MTQTDLPALAHDLRALVGGLRRAMREHSSAEDFTPSQTSVLVLLLTGEPHTVTTLARAEGVRSQSMGATVAALQDAGLVQGAADPADGRRTILSLTDTALERIVANRVAKEDWLVRAIGAEFTASELHDLERGVQLLQRLVD